MAQEDVFKKLVSHCKEYGFVLMELLLELNRQGTTIVMVTDGSAK